MDRKSNLEKLRECFNESQFFSTQMSSNSNISKESPRQQKNMFRISSRFTDDPPVYLKKMKARQKQAGRQHLQALRCNIRAKSSLQRVERDASLYRYQFIKLYQNKKFRLQEKTRMDDHDCDTEHQFRTSVERFRERKILQQISMSVKKEQKLCNLQILVDKKKSDQKILRDSLRNSEERIKRRVEANHEKIRRQRDAFEERKRNWADLAETKSKFNYMVKVNEQMKQIMNCQNRLNEMEEQNPEGEGDALPSIFATFFTPRLL